MTTQSVLRRAWESEIAYCRDHIEYFVDHYGHIEDKDSIEIIQPFRMWDEQRKALQSINEHRLNIVLKARQLGITWMALHVAAHEMLTMRGRTVVALSKTEEDGKELIRRICVIFDAMPELVRREDWYGAKLESSAMSATLTFPNGLQSVIKAFPAAPGAGRSFTANLVILDEWAFQQYAREIWGAAYPTINRPTGGKVIGLSTIKRGSLFEELWCGEDNGFNKIFIPWYADPRRDQRWYEQTRNAIGIDLLMAEYPATPEEALTVPGGAFFPEVKEEIHITDKPPQEPIQRYISIDYGLDALAAIWYGIELSGRVTVYRELYKSGLIVADAASAIKAASGREHIEGIYAPPDLWNRNRDTGRSTAEIFNDAGLPLIKTSNDRVQGWLDVKEWIKPVEETNEQTGARKLTSRLQILRGTAPNLWRCLTRIQKDEKKPNDAANDPHELTHLPDSLRAFCAGRPTPPELPSVRDYDEPATEEEQIDDFFAWGR
jgi:hypothetical protein